MKQRDGFAPPTWLNGETIAIVSTVLTVGVGIGAMVFASTSSIRGEVSSIRGEVSSVRGEVDGLATKLEETHRSLAARINATRLELSDEIEATRLELSDKIEKLDARLRVVENVVAGIQAGLGARNPVTQGANLSDPEDDADA